MENLSRYASLASYNANDALAIACAVIVCAILMRFIREEGKLLEETKTPCDYSYGKLREARQALADLYAYYKDLKRGFFTLFDNKSPLAAKATGEVRLQINNVKREVRQLGHRLRPYRVYRSCLIASWAYPVTLAALWHLDLAASKDISLYMMLASVAAGFLSYPMPVNVRLFVKIPIRIYRTVALQSIILMLASILAAKSIFTGAAGY